MTPRGDQVQLGLGLLALVAAALALMGPAVSFALAWQPRNEFYHWWQGVFLPLAIAAGAAIVSLAAILGRAMMAWKRRSRAGHDESTWAIVVLVLAVAGGFVMARWIFSWPLT